MSYPFIRHAYCCWWIIIEIFQQKKSVLKSSSQTLKMKYSTPLIFYWTSLPRNCQCNPFTLRLFSISLSMTDRTKNYQNMHMNDSDASYSSQRPCLLIRTYMIWIVFVAFEYLSNNLISTSGHWLEVWISFTFGRSTPKFSLCRPSPGFSVARQVSIQNETGFFTQIIRVLRGKRVRLFLPG